MSDKDGRPIAQGSGFVVSRDGRIVTNYHVIKSGSSAIVKLPDGAFFPVDGLIAFDKDSDIAIIKAHGENFRTVTLGDSGRVQVGDEVIAIGNPLSLESTVSNGIVSAIRTIEEKGGKFLQITAPISPGSSGGPLFNTAGEVVGITTLYLKGGENLNFAIPVDGAKRLLRENLSKVHDFPNEGSEDAASSTGFLSNKQVCLDGVIHTVETSFMYIGQACVYFVVQFPLAPEDAQLLEGHSPEDDELLKQMQVQSLSALSLQLMNGTKQPSQKTGDLWPTMIGAIWSSFERKRGAFCSRHPRMFVFGLELDGTRTPPQPCTPSKPKR
jgi:hypothetical protein